MNTDDLQRPSDPTTDQNLEALIATNLTKISLIIGLSSRAYSFSFSLTAVMARNGASSRCTTPLLLIYGQNVVSSRSRPVQVSCSSSRVWTSLIGLRIRRAQDRTRCRLSS